MGSVELGVLGVGIPEAAGEATVPSVGMIVSVELAAAGESETSMVAERGKDEIGTGKDDVLSLSRWEPGGARIMDDKDAGSMLDKMRELIRFRWVRVRAGSEVIEPRAGLLAWDGGTEGAAGTNAKSGNVKEGGVEGVGSVASVDWVRCEAPLSPCELVVCDPPP